jgi:hypothetical protein
MNLHHETIETIETISSHVDDAHFHLEVLSSPFIVSIVQSQISHTTSIRVTHSITGAPIEYAPVQFLLVRFSNESIPEIDDAIPAYANWTETQIQNVKIRNKNK